MPWQVVDAETGHAVTDRAAPRFPKLALRSAFNHRAPGDCASWRASETREVLLRGRAAWDKILVKYKCVEPVTSQGSGATIRKTYMSQDRKFQYLHTHINIAHGDVQFTDREFVIFPP